MNQIVAFDAVVPLINTLILGNLSVHITLNHIGLLSKTKFYDAYVADSIGRAAFKLQCFAMPPFLVFVTQILNYQMADKCRIKIQQRFGPMLNL